MKNQRKKKQMMHDHDKEQIHDHDVSTNPQEGCNIYTNLKKKCL